jgi:hypothetical protein
VRREYGADVTPEPRHTCHVEFAVEDDGGFGVVVPGLDMQHIAWGGLYVT